MGLSGHLHVGAAVGTLNDFVGKTVEGRHNLGVGVLPAHEPLDGEQSILRVGDRLTFGDLAYVPFAGFCVNGHYGRSQPGTLRVFDYYGFSGLYHSRN